MIEKIELHMSKEGEISIVGKWPKQACITPDLNTVRSLIEITENGHIKINVTNGWAIYKLAMLQPWASGFVIDRLIYFIEGQQEGNANG